ncbi:MAG: DevR family CRISPR-associated autoregulator [Blastocatellia bacterium]|nr:DevR family CRISPR-associated autoregulator [Blastocatellia bacterium]
MATNYLYGTILTGEAVAANNRGDNIGNTTTLQKVFHQDDLHTSVSAEAIRFALRYRFQLELQDSQVNRTYNVHSGKVNFKDDKWLDWKPVQDIFVDDDLMGFMNAAAAKNEREDEDSEQDKSKDTSGKKPKGKAYKRTSPLAMGRAVSLRPYRGELSYNCTVRKEDEKGNAAGLSLYNAEMHTTEYQYSFGLNLNDVVNKQNISHVIDAIIDPPPVAGNHSRFAFDFSPASIVLRVTNAHSSKIQNCFEHDDETRGYHIARLVKRVESGDIPAHELIIGGEVATTEAGARLQELGATVVSGVLAAATEAKNKIAAMDASLRIVGGQS